MKKTTTTFSTMKQANMLVFFFVLLFGSMQAINAEANCHASFTVTTSDLTAFFTDASTSDHTITSWSWDFGDGYTSTDQNPSHTYAYADTFEVCLTIHDDHGCSSAFCHHVEVHAVQTNCHASFTFHASGLIVNFTDASTADGIISSWYWDFGDGHTSTDQNSSHTYAANGTYHVCLTIHDSHGCTSTYCHDVTVHTFHHHCHASFTFFSDSTFFHFTSTSTGTTATTTYSWDFGDGTTSDLQNPTHTYNHSGHYTVCLTITDTATNCSSHYCHTVTVNHHLNNHVQGPVAELTFNSIEEQKQTVVTYPNPIIESATVEYSLNETSTVTIAMFDMIGNKIFELANLNETEGVHTHFISGDHLQTGLYLLKLTINNHNTVTKITVSK